MFVTSKCFLVPITTALSMHSQREYTIVVIIFGDLLQLFWRGNAITFEVRLGFKNKYVELLREV